MEIVEDRYDARSICITSQVPVDHWYEIIGNPTLSDAILDRVVHNAYRIELSGDSLRKRRTHDPRLDLATPANDHRNRPVRAMHQVAGFASEYLAGISSEWWPASSESAVITVDADCDCAVRSN